MSAIDDIRKTLEPFHELLCECVTAGWQRWKTEFAPRLQMPYRRCRANLVYDLIIEEARRRLSAVPGVTIAEGKQRCLLKIGDLLLRFKKVREGLQTSNYPTQAAIKFDNQMQLPGVPKGTRVTIGYRLDALEQQLRAVFVILAVGRHILGFYELEIGGTMTATLPPTPIVPFPTGGTGGRISRKRTEKTGEVDKDKKEEK